LVFENLAGFIGADFPVDKVFLRLDQVLHAGFDDLEVLRGEGAGQIEVVVETVLNRRTDGDLRFGEHLQDRFCHDVGGGVADPIKF